MSALTWINGQVLGRNTWPPDDATRDLWEELDAFAGMLASDEHTMLMLAQSYGMSGGRQNYLPLPVPRLISKVKTNLLFGRAPRVTSEQAADQPLLDDLIEQNAMLSELRRGQMICSSEGEVWWRVLVAPNLLDWPLIEFSSRRHVLPRFAGRSLVGATFVFEYPDGPNGVWRVLEDHQRGLVQTRLYRGTRTQLGRQAALSEHPSTEGQQPEMATYGELLCGWVPNALDRDPTRGVSDYLGVVLGFFALNEAATVGQSNVRLVGRKRLFVDGRYLNARGNLPGDDDVYQSDRTELMPGESGGIKGAEYTFESSELTGWIHAVIDLVLTFAGVSPASVGRGSEGAVRTGTAMKLKMAHTLMEAAGTGENWDRSMRRALKVMQVLDAREFGRPWAAVDSLPSFLRSDGLPQDTLETAQELQMLEAARAISTEQKVRMIHPDWSDEQVAAEVEKIDTSAQAGQAPLPGGEQGTRISPPEPPAVVLGGQGAAAR